MRAALLSHVLPGAPSGQGVMLGRLLPSFPEPPLVIASPRASAIQVAHATPPAVSGRQTLGEPGNGSHTAGQSIVELPPDIPRHAGNALLPLVTLRRARRIAALLVEHQCRALIACSGDLVDLPAGKIAARLAGVPFVAWLFDPYAGQWPGRAMNLFAGLAERWVLTGAAAVIVPNEFAQQVYEHRYGRSPTVVRNPLPDDYPFDDRPVVARTSIRYTGAVYRVNGWGLRRLAATLEQRRYPEAFLDVFASQDPRYLNALRPCPTVRLFPPVDQVQALAVQRSAGALYLPLGRRREFAARTRAGMLPSVLNLAEMRSSLTLTAAPAKLGEYLASGRPVLACVPPRSFIAWYLRRHDAGLVVDDSAGATLSDAVEQLLRGGPVLERLVDNARERARCDFAPQPARATLRELVNRIM